MKDIIHLTLSFFGKMPPEWATALVAVMPVVELRGAIPFGVSQGLPPITAGVIAFAANWAAMVIVMFLLPLVVDLAASYWPWLHRLLERIFAKTRKDYSDKIKRLEHVGLILFVGIPLPGTGVFTGALIAYLFGFPFWRSVRDMTIGLIISASIVTLLTSGALKLFF